MNRAILGATNLNLANHCHSLSLRERVGERGLFLLGALVRCLSVGLLLCGSSVHAEQNLDLQGATITGNRELPKVLYIVPWKQPDPADLGAGAGPNMMDEVLAPVDRDVFKRQLQYYDALHSRR